MSRTEPVSPQGDWVPVAADVSGRELDVASLRVARLIIDGAAYRIVDHADRTVDSGDFLLRETLLPRSADLVGLAGPHSGRRILAIFECDGERLLLCYDLENAARPLQMQPLGDQLLLRITYVRAGVSRRLS